MSADIVIVGGGHNALVAATYLSRAGRSVLVLERRDAVGGAAVSERPFAGQDARLSRYAYLVSLFPQTIADDLGIELRLARRPVAAYADGLLIDANPATERTRASFAALGAEHDHRLWLALEARWPARPPACSPRSRSRCPRAPKRPSCAATRGSCSPGARSARRSTSGSSTRSSAASSPPTASSAPSRASTTTR